MDYILQFVPILIQFIGVTAQLLRWVLIISVLMSWFAGPTRTPFGMYIEYITRTLTKPFKWARLGAFDFSVILAYISLNLISYYAIRFLQGLA